MSESDIFKRIADASLQYTNDADWSYITSHNLDIKETILDEYWKQQGLEYKYTYSGSELVDDVLSKNGWTWKNGKWVKPTTLIDTGLTETGSSVATQTATNVLNVADDVVIDTTAKEVSVKTATNVSLRSPKTILACVLTACIGYDIGVGIYELWDKYFGDGSFNWDKYSIGGKIMTYLNGGKSYLDESLISDILNHLKDKGFFEDEFELFTGNCATFGELMTHNNFQNVRKYIGDVNDFFSDMGLTEDTVNDYLITGYSYAKQGTRSTEYNEIIYAIQPYNESTTIDRTYTTKSGAKVWMSVADESKVWSDQTGSSSSYRMIRKRYYRYWYSDDATYRKSNTSYNDYGVKNIYLTQSEYFNMIKNNTTDTVKYIPMVSPFSTLSSKIAGMIPDNEDATMPDFNKTLADNYPDWYINAKTQTVNDGNTTTTNTVLPLTINEIVPEGSVEPDSSIKPNSAVQQTAQTGTYNKGDTDALTGLQDAYKEMTEPDVDTDGDMVMPTKPDGFFPDAGANDDPMILNPTTDSMLGLVALYNPTVVQIKEFSQFLWGNDFVSAFKKLFSDPMQAVIGLHWIYATPNKSTVSTIKVGYVDSGVESVTVPDIYTTIDCGSIHVNHVFNNALDYKALHCSIYLPFIGIKELSIGDVMDSDVHVKYNVDHLTGTCLATIQIKREGLDAGIYQFTGNCAVQLPISGGSYTSIITNLVGLAATIGTTVATGGSLAPIAVGQAANLLTNSKTSTERTGSIGSNAGAMGYKKPFLLIQGNKSYNATGYSNYMGDASNSAVTLKQCKGFQRVKDINLSVADATEQEKTEIIHILKSGFFVS